MDAEQLLAAFDACVTPSRAVEVEVARRTGLWWDADFACWRGTGGARLSAELVRDAIVACRRDEKEAARGA